MIIKVSKVFANFINETAKEFGKKFHAEVVKFSTIGDEVDYDWSTGRFRNIQITYPYGYYAVPQYFSTRYLVREFKRRGVKTVEDLKKMIVDICEI